MREPEHEKQWLGPKPWAEVSVEEKLERLRQEMDGWRREVARLRGLVTLLQRHDHTGDGKVRVDLQEAENFFRTENSCASINTLR